MKDEILKKWLGESLESLSDHTIWQIQSAMVEYAENNKPKMKWIKASERMPTVPHSLVKLFVRYTDVNKKFVVNGGIDFKVQIDLDGYCYKKELVEWLEEQIEN